jgi:hypothetical protein
MTNVRTKAVATNARIMILAASLLARRQPQPMIHCCRDDPWPTGAHRNESILSPGKIIGIARPQSFTSLQKAFGNNTKTPNRVQSLL